MRLNSVTSAVFWLLAAFTFSRPALADRDDPVRVLVEPLPRTARYQRMDDATEAELARGARLATILGAALQRNRDIAADRSRAVSAEARHRAASRLPDLDFKYEQWGVPLARPHALDRADTLMFGVRQALPAWGTLQARGRAAAEEAGGARDAADIRRQDIAAQVNRTFVAYFNADQEVRLHLDHVELTTRVLDLARLNQKTGHGSLQDVLRLQLELTRLHTDVARIERERRSSRALLNTLMDRQPDAPLGPPEDLAEILLRDRPGIGTVPAGPVDVAALEKGLDAGRPEIAAAGRSVRRTEASLDELRRAARIPNLMVGLDYWYMPTRDVRHGYGAMLAINLPWLSGRRGDEQAAAEQMLRAERHALESARNEVRYQLHDAAARFDSARQTLAIIDTDLLVQARRSLEATQAAYAAGQGDGVGLVDGLRSYLQVRIERVRAVAELAASQAELRRAAGVLVEKEGAR